MQAEYNSLDQLKRDIHNEYIKKYGNDVSIDIDDLQANADETVQIRVTISKDDSFVTRHYGKAYYRGTQLYLKTRTI